MKMTSIFRKKDVSIGQFSIQGNKFLLSDGRIFSNPLENGRHECFKPSVPDGGAIYRPSERWSGL